jgi:diguanylate cyclase (GGDEF)-like protein
MLQGDASSTDFRIVTRSGNVRELRGHGRALMDELSGQVERIYGAAQDITDRKSWEAALQHQALHDALTDLPNRTLLQNRLAATIAASRRDASSLALLMMDLDHFKEVNDTFGHHLGDLLLQRVGQRLRGSVRASDTVARLGGDEFAVLLPSASTADAQHVAAKLLRVLETPFEIDGHNLKIGASIGVAMCPEHAVDADALQRHADSAMYVAKRLGGGCHLHTPPSEVRQAA